MQRLILILKRFSQKLQKIPNNLAIICIRCYRAVLSPSVGVLRYMLNLKPVCIFYPTCSEYAILCYKKYSFLLATKKTLRRVSRCHPGNTPEVDMP